jgi:ubiquinone/menaquinone biosynthesis C-methylase UbiE
LIEGLQNRIEYFDRIAGTRLKKRKLNGYYWNDITKYCEYFSHEDYSVLEVGCGTGELLSSLKGKNKTGIDFSQEMITIARTQFPEIDFKVMTAEEIVLDKKFDLIIISNLIGYLEDIEAVFKQLHKVCHERTKIIVTYYNYLWEPILTFGEKIGLKTHTPKQNWLTIQDINNLLYTAGFDVYRNTKRMIFPLYIPLLSNFLNKYLAKLPFFNFFSINYYTFAKPLSSISEKEWTERYSVSIVIPARNESGNIENAIKRLPKFGKETEIIFVEGNSTDDTWSKIQEIQKKICRLT